MRHNLCLKIALAIQLSAAAATAQNEYAVKPAWWDEAKPVIVNGRDLQDGFNQTWTATRAEQAKVEGWKCLGPFDTHQSRAFENVYPPEEKVDLSGTYTDKDGQSIHWLDWAPESPPPFPKDKQNMVLFFFREFPAETARRQTFLIASDDGAEAWWNGQSVYRFPGDRAMNLDYPDSFTVDVRAGGNTLLVKVQQGVGDWGLALWQVDRDPLPMEIRMRTMLQQRYPEARVDQRRDFCRRIADGYFILNDPPNAVFWYHRELLAYGDKAREARQRMEEIGRRLLALSLSADLDALLLPIALDEALASEARAAAARIVLEQHLEARQYAEVLALLDQHREPFAAILGREVGYFRLKTYIRIGDYDAAYRIMVGLEKEPDIEKDQQYRMLKDAVAGMRASTTQLKEDWDLETNLAAAAKSAREQGPRRLARFIRNILSSKANALIDTGDGILFDGALFRYRLGLAEYREPYRRELAEYLALRAGKLDLSPVALRGCQARLSLDPPAAETVAPSHPPALDDLRISVPADGTFQPLASLAIGTIDRESARDIFRRRINRIPPAWGVMAGPDACLQTSRQMLCLRDGRVAWSRSLPNSSPGDGSADVRLLGLGFAPQSDGERVYARLFADGRFQLFAFHLVDGATAWTFNREDRDLCSDPMLCGDRVFAVVRQREVICRYFLVSLAAADGELLDEVFLFGAPETMPVSRFAREIQFDRFMPSFRMDGNRAFFSPNAGVVVALDLDATAPLWIRKYSRIPFGVSEGLSALLGHRRICAPVTGDKNVLFAPVDAAAVLLLDRESGRLVAESTSLDWSEIHPWDGTHALLLDAEDRLSLISLDDLSVHELAMPDNRGWQVHAVCRDGVVLLRQNQLRLLAFDGRIVREETLPGNYRPLPGLVDLALGYRTDSLLPVVGSWGASTAAVPSPSQERDVPGDALEDPLFRLLGEDVFLLSSNYLQRLGSDFQARWSAPVLQRNPVLLPASGVLYLVHSDQIFVLDRDSGRYLASYPEADSAYAALSAPSLIGEDLFFGEVPFGENRTFIRRMSPDGSVATLGVVPHDTVAKVIDEGRRIIALNQHAMAWFVLDPATGQYAPETETLELRMNRWDYRFWPLPDGNTLLFNGNQVLNLPTGAGKPSEIPRAFEGNPWWGMGYPENQVILGDLFCCRLIDSRWMITDPRQGKDLAARIDTRVMPAIGGSFLAGAQQLPERNRVRVTVAERDLGKSAYTADVDLGSKLRWGVATPIFSLVFPDGLALHLLYPNNNANHREDFAAVLQDPHQQTTTVSSFPGPGPYRAAATTDSHAALLMGNRLLIFTRDELLAYLSPPTEPFIDAPVVVQREKQDQFEKNIAIDGFPDEWDLASLRLLGRNAVAAVAVRGQLYVLCELRDPELIRQVGAAGFDRRIRGRFLPGGTAGLVEVIPPPKGLAFTLAPPAPGETRDWQAAWSMAPAGDRAWLELRLPAQTLYGMNWDFGRIAREQIPFREWRGDLSFQLFLSLPDGTDVPFFADVPAPPVKDPRWRFVEQQP